MLDEIFEIFEEEIDEVSIGSVIGVVAESERNDEFGKLVSEISTISSAVDLAGGDVSLSALLMLLKDQN